MERGGFLFVDYADGSLVYEWTDIFGSRFQATYPHRWFRVPTDANNVLAAAVCPKCRTKDFDKCHSIRCPMRKEEEKVKTEWDIRKCFEQLRFDKNHHLGLGDIRLTIAQQEEICELVERFYRYR